MDALFAGLGAIRALCRAIDWNGTPLGPVGGWPESLRVAVRICLDTEIPMAVWAGPDLALIYNESYLPVLGTTKHPWALGRTGREVWAEFWDLLGPDLKSVVEHGETVYREDERFLLRRRGQPEEEKFFTYSYSPIRGDDGRVVGALNLFQDSTARVQSAREHERLLEVAREEKERLRTLINSIGDEIWFADMNREFTLANPAAAREFELPGASVGVEHLVASLEVLRPDGTPRPVEEAPPLRAQVGQVIRNEEEIIRTPATGQLRHRQVSAAPVKDSHGTIIGSVSVVRDITERKQAEARLRESEERLRTLFDTMIEGFCIVEVVFDADDRPIDYRFLEINSAFEAQTGLKDAQGRLMRELAPDHEAHWFEIYGDVARTGRPARFVNEARALGRWYDVSAYRVGGADSRKVAILFNDISERKRIETALQEANEQLREENRRKNNFLAVLSHELRNPLAPIRNSTYILERAAPGGDQARRALAVIDRQAGQLAHLVDDLLDVTRITTHKVQLQRQTLELNELVRRTLEDQRSLFEKAEVLLELVPAPAPVYVSADWNRLAQVVGNLLQNAAKFTGRGGATRITIHTDAAENRAVIQVADTGVGMSPEMVSRLFEPFSQADSTLDRSKGGLGLGLALVKGLVELHGGNVTAHSAGLGNGAEFVVRLPLTMEEVAVPRPGTGVATRRRRVLVIEDNIDAADSLREALELGEHEVSVAYNGPEGLAKAREFHPEVVLCDIGLPGMDGYAVARAVRADDSLKAVILVAVSGYALPEDLRRAQEAGFQRHLAKPPSLEKLEALLAEAPAVAPAPPAAPPTASN